MKTGFLMNKGVFAAQIGAMGARMRADIMARGRREGKKALRDILGSHPTEKGKIPTAKLARNLDRTGYKSWIEAQIKKAQAAAQPAIDAAVLRVKKSLETRKIRKAYHQLILKDEKRTMKEDLAEFVRQRWWIPQEFGVTHHHGLGSYVYLVSINIATTVGSYFVGAKVLSYANKARKLTMARKARVVLRKRKRLKKVATAGAKAGRRLVQQQIDDSDTLEKLDRALQNRMETAAMSLYDGVQGLLNKRTHF